MVGIAYFAIRWLPVFQTDVDRETIVVALDDPEPVWTNNTFSGQVRLVMSGTGQAAGTDWSDAFYLYTQNGELLNDPLPNIFGLEIDGQRALDALGLTENPPPFTPEHVYQVIYAVGTGSRQIAFRVDDTTVGDNTGEFQIVVEQLAE